mmetsp:Transcript_117709/g.251506  ORF Transcript_117709/g.251506 Transcript_117709/m.251506 type:complete len:202 (+) Transcript_117709:165-770(+)
MRTCPCGDLELELLKLLAKRRHLLFARVGGGLRLGGHALSLIYLLGHLLHHILRNPLELRSSALLVLVQKRVGQLMTVILLLIIVPILIHFLLLLLILVPIVTTMSIVVLMPIPRLIPWAPSPLCGRFGTPTHPTAYWTVSITMCHSRSGKDNKLRKPGAKSRKIAVHEGDIGLKKPVTYSWLQSLEPRARFNISLVPSWP